MAAIVLAAWSGGLVAAESPDAAAKQQKALAVLRSEAPPAEKAIVCKQLAVYGTKEAVPVLAPLLANPDLSSWARIALEAIPDASANDALLEGLGKVQGRLAIGVINSLGVRHDPRSVPALVARLKDTDTGVLSAAANALGRIGGPVATTALLDALPGAPAAARGEVAEGCILCAEKLLAGGDAAGAIRLYDTIRRAAVPKLRVIEATRGAILARQAGGVPLLLEQLRSSDKAMFGVGLRVARELPGPEATQALAAELDRIAPERQAAVVQALADRGDASVLPVLSKVARTGTGPAKVAAVTAIEKTAGVAGVPMLVEMAADPQADLARAARTVLARLPGKDVDAAIVARLSQATGKVRQVLVEAAGQRRLTDALPAIARAAEDADAGVRSAAAGALGLMGDEKQLGDLVRLLAKAPTAKDRDDIETALLSISGRRGAVCAATLLPLARDGQAAVRVVGLHTLAGAGGPEALAAVKNAVDDADPTVQDEAVRSLATWANNWPEEAGLSETLLALAKSGRKKTHQVLALRGYLQWLQGDKKLGDETRAAKFTEVKPLLRTPEDKRAALAVASAIPTADGLKLLLGFAEDAAVAEDACQAIVTLAAKGDLKGATKESRTQALLTVLDKSKNERTRAKADEALKKLR
jgi:HEAT repeat protein